jgi:hypothetical protein
MAPLVNVVKFHQLKNGFVKMEQLDETTGLRFYLHSNKLTDKPILLFPGGMVKLVQALPKAYEIYDEQALIRAKVAESDGAEAVVDDEVIYSVNIATSKVLQINLEISVYKGKLYIFLKKSNWAEEEGGGASGDSVAATFYSTATKTTPRLYFNLPCRLTKRNKEKKCA